MYMVDIPYMYMVLCTLCVRRKHKNMSPCTGSVNTSYERSTSCTDSQFRARTPESPGNSATHYCAECPNTRTGPTGQKRIGTRRMVSHTRHNSEPILGRNASPLGCLHLALAYRYHFCIFDGNTRTSPCTGSRVNQLWVNCIMCWIPISNAGPGVLKQTPLLTIVPSVLIIRHQIYKEE